MLPVKSEQFIKEEGMCHSLPIDYHLPCITSSDIAFQENKNGIYRPKSQLSVESKDFSAAFGNNLDKIQSTSNKSSVTDESMIFQNFINENLLRISKYLQNDSSNFRLRKKIGRKRNQRRRRVLHQVLTLPQQISALPNSSKLSQRGYQGWNHEPRMNWSQSNSHTRPVKANFQNTLQSGSLNKCAVNPQRFQNSTMSEFPSTLCNSSDSTIASGAVVSGANFTSRNPTNNCLEKKMGSAISRSSRTFYNSSKSGVMERKAISEVNSSSNSRNFEKFKECNEDDDITYLFTVDASSEERVVLEIDLQSETTNLVPNKSSIEIVNLINESKTDAISVKRPESTSLPKIRKRKLSNKEIGTNKRTSNQPKCTVCAKDYTDIVGKNGNMYISSSCSHIFCRACMDQKGSSKTCPTCGIGFLIFHRLFL